MKKERPIPKEFLTREEEATLAKAWREKGDEKARARILRAYNKLAVAFAKKAMRPGLSEDELIQEAIIGMMHALDRFEPERGYAFATFCRYHIKSQLQIHTLEQFGPVRIFNTSKTKSLLGRFNRLRKEWEHRKGRELDQEGKLEICTELEIKLEELERFMMAMAIPKSVIPQGNNNDDDNEARTVKEIADSDATPDQRISEEMGLDYARSLIKEALDTMDTRDAWILAQRHLGEDNVTLDSLAEKLNISRERVRQLESRALGKLKAFLEKRGFSDTGAFFD